MRAAAYHRGAPNIMRKTGKVMKKPLANTQIKVVVVLFVFAVFSLQVRSMPNSANGYVTMTKSDKEKMDMFLLNWTEL